MSTPDDPISRGTHADRVHAMACAIMQRHFTNDAGELEPSFSLDEIPRQALRFVNAVDAALAEADGAT